MDFFFANRSIYSASIRMFSLSENEMELIERKSTVGSFTALIQNHFSWSDHSTFTRFSHGTNRILRLHFRSRYGHGGSAEGEAKSKIYLG